MRSTLNRGLANVSVLLISVVLAIGAGEIIARIFFEREPSVHQALFVEYDPLLGWRKIPNASGELAREKGSIFESINTKGIRGPEYAYEKEPDEFRILVLGDSFAEGYSVDFNELFSEVLKGQLNLRQDRYFETINTGTAGYSTDQELLYFQHEGRKFTPDLTILLFYYNDVYYNTRRNYWRGNKPAFELQNNQLVLTGTPVPRPGPTPRKPGYSPRAPGEDDRLQPHRLMTTAKKWLYEHSSLYRLATLAIKNHHVLYRLAVKLSPIEVGRASESIEVPEALRVWENKQSESMRQAWQITEALIKQLKVETDKVGSDLLIFYVPHRVRIYEEDWIATKRKYGLNDDSWDLSLVARNLKDICGKYGIDFIDPVAEFKAQMARTDSQGGWLYNEGDTHWTADGNALVGRILARYVNEKYPSFD